MTLYRKERDQYRSAEARRPFPLPNDAGQADLDCGPPDLDASGEVGLSLWVEGGKIWARGSFRSPTSEQKIALETSLPDGLEELFVPWRSQQPSFNPFSLPETQLNISQEWMGRASSVFRGALSYRSDLAWGQRARLREALILDSGKDFLHFLWDEPLDALARAWDGGLIASVPDLPVQFSSPWADGGFIVDDTPPGQTAPTSLAGVVRSLAAGRAGEAGVVLKEVAGAKVIVVSSMEFRGQARADREILMRVAKDLAARRPVLDMASDLTDLRGKGLTLAWVKWMFSEAEQIGLPLESLEDGLLGFYRSLGTQERAAARGQGLPLTPVQFEGLAQVLARAGSLYLDSGAGREGSPLVRPTLKPGSLFEEPLLVLPKGDPAELDALNARLLSGAGTTAVFRISEAPKWFQEASEAHPFVEGFRLSQWASTQARSGSPSLPVLIPGLSTLLSLEAYRGQRLMAAAFLLIESGDRRDRADMGRNPLPGWREASAAAVARAAAAQPHRPPRQAPPELRSEEQGSAPGSQRGS